jgi:hypothetical protein
VRVPIPLVAIEEHNEAFYVWYHAREVGWLAEADNILLHVDDHADLRLSISREPLPPRHDPVAAARYTYTRTNIANFIWPTVYSRVFNKVYWLRRKHQAKAGGWRRVKLDFDRERLPLPWRMVERFALDPLDTAPGEVACEYAPMEPGDRLRPAAPLALDIDLDYFSANDPPDKPELRWRLEESFAREIIENPYHWTRVESYPTHVEQDANGHWVLSSLEEPVRRPKPEASQPPDEVIPEALARFGAYLDEFRLRPAVITICRSEYSGYAPKAFVRQIEQGVRALLEARYEIEEHSLNALLPDGWKVPARLLRTWPW